MNPQWPDIALLSYISFFGVLCAILIVKRDRLGWAMFAKNMAYALAFGWAAVMVAVPQIASEDVRRVVRIIVALSVTWAIYELIAVRVRHYRDTERG